MKITYLKLVNFANIFAGMGKREIELDLSKSINKIILLVGPNGSGKTSILSELHPFAYSGNMDVRNNTSMILENSKGLKEIHFNDNGIEYIIKHHYSRTEKTNSVKSFIMKDNKELNPNGNVRSFNEVVERELGITLDYLKLIRLGSNVTGFMDMKATDRKVYVGSFLDDTDMWLSLYKKVNNDFRALNGIISSTNNKLTNLNITDINALDTQSNELKQTISNYVENRNRLTEKVGEINGKILALVPEGVDSLKDENEKNLKNLAEKTKELRANISIRNQFTIITDDINEFKNAKILERDSYNIEIAKIDGMMLNILDNINDNMNQREEIQTKLGQLGGDSQYNRLMNLYTDLDLSVSNAEKKYKNYKPVTSRETMFHILSTLTEIDSIVKDIYGFSKAGITTTIELIQNGEDVRKYIKDKLSKLETQRAQSKIKRPDDTFIVYRPHNCPEDNCPYLKMHNILFPDNNEEEINTDIKREILEDIDNVNYNIIRIASILKSTLQSGSIPDEYKEMLSFNKILTSIKNDKMIYNEEKITKIIAEIDDYNEYIINRNTLKDIKLELKSFDNTNTEKSTLTKKLTDITKNIGKLSEKRDKLENDKNKIIEYLENVNDTISTAEIVIEYNQIILDLIKETEALSVDISKTNLLIHSVKDDVEKLNIVQNDILKCDESINEFNNELALIDSKRNDYVSLTNTITTLNTLYEELSYTRDSLSSTKGIPLVKLQSFFKGTQMYVNELLDIVYNGNLQITDFDISETEFNIPYKKGSVKIDDVRYASQGETSFLSIAISFALMNQAMSNYNIPLLDEPDSTLDSSNRALFLDILERQITDVEQVFMITHNDMFDNYPVDLILTSNYTTVTTKNRNILFSPE